jgi:hypothetical protein
MAIVVLTSHARLVMAAVLLPATPKSSGFLGGELNERIVGKPTSALPIKADVACVIGQVRFVPKIELWGGLPRLKSFGQPDSGIDAI